MAMIGKMRQRITFKAPAATPVGGGGQVVTYDDVLTDWAKVQQLRSDIGVAAFQTSQGNTYQFTLRWRTGFTPVYDMLVAYDGRLFTIAAIDDVGERDRYWQITGNEKHN